MHLKVNNYFSETKYAIAKSKNLNKCCSNCLLTSFWIKLWEVELMVN